MFKMYFILEKRARIRSLDVKNSKNGRTIRMICRSKKTTNPSEISWTKDGRPITSSDNIKIKTKR